MAEAFAGKWKAIKIEGADDYFTAIGQPDMAKDIYNITEVEVQVEGKNVTTITNIEGKEPKRDELVLDQTTETDGPNGVKIVSKAYIDGDKFKQEGTAGDNSWTVVRYIEDGACISEITAKEKTLKITMIRK
ncbi:hypothetical protein Btru_054363 [Bulinus truncatus]|nr:hypothetical protein Btru_054363 [Bulinus truncatus]